LKDTLQVLYDLNPVWSLFLKIQIQIRRNFYLVWPVHFCQAQILRIIVEDMKGLALI